MATAELTGNPLTMITRTATPLAGNEITVGPSKFRNPVFFAPHSGVSEENAYWGILMGQTARVLYTFATWGEHPSVFRSAGGVSAFEWERLSLELMRIANLESNWDGEGGEAVQQSTVTTTTILLTIAKSVMERFADSPSTVPALFPTVEGGAALNWIRGQKELKCTVFGDIVEVVRWRSPDRFESDGLWEIPVPRVREHFEWLFQ
jgi:hypothetical protein